LIIAVRAMSVPSHLHYGSPGLTPAHLHYGSPGLTPADTTIRFPMKLWRLANKCTTGSIVWSIAGRSIRIEKNKFVRDFFQVGRMAFKTEHFASFVRQLNLYGFRKVSTAVRIPDENDEPDGDYYEYFHPMFRCNRPELLPLVQRRMKTKKQKNEFVIIDENGVQIPWPNENFPQMRAIGVCTNNFNSKNVYLEVIHKYSAKRQYSISLRSYTLGNIKHTVQLTFGNHAASIVLMTALLLSITVYRLVVGCFLYSIIMYYVPFVVILFYM
jgi:hypothetical protein